MIFITWQSQSSNRDPDDGGDTVDMTFDALEIDGSFRESYSYDQSITSNPVERDVEVSDHSTRLPNTIELDLVVSDDPYIESLQEDNHTIEVRDRLLFLKERAIPIQLETDRGFFENYLIKQLVDNRDPRTGAGGKFSMTFRELQFASTEEVVEPAPIVERARRRSDRGNQSTRDTGSTDTIAEDSPDESIALNLPNYLLR